MPINKSGFNKVASFLIIVNKAYHISYLQLSHL